jgi:hypothetical protein
VCWFEPCEDLYKKALYQLISTWCWAFVYLQRHQPRVLLELQQAKTAALESLLHLCVALLPPKPLPIDHAIWQQHKQQSDLLWDQQC